MPDPTQLALYFAAALVLAATPGPGIFYVAARTLAGGRAEGVASSFGTGLGGMAHVLAGSLGVSAVVLASAELFTALKLIGAAYLIWLGLRTFQSARRDAATGLKGGSAAPPIGPRRAFREGVLVEALNRRQQPSSSPSFRSSWPRRKATSRCNSWCLASSRLRSTTLADIVVAFAASGIREGAAARPALIRRLREGSGAAMMALGIGLAFANALRTDRWAALL